MQKIFIIKTLKSPYDSPLEGEIKGEFYKYFYLPLILKSLRNTNLTTRETL